MGGRIEETLALIEPYYLRQVGPGVMAAEGHRVATQDVAFERPRAAQSHQVGNFTVRKRLIAIYVYTVYGISVKGS